MLPDTRDHEFLRRHWLVEEPPSALYARLTQVTRLPQHQPWLTRLLRGWDGFTASWGLRIATQGAALAVCALLGVYAAQLRPLSTDYVLDAHSLAMADNGTEEL